MTYNIVFLPARRLLKCVLCGENRLGGRLFAYPDSVSIDRVEPCDAFKHTVNQQFYPTTPGLMLEESLCLS